MTKFEHATTLRKAYNFTYTKENQESTLCRQRQGSVLRYFRFKYVEFLQIGTTVNGHYYSSLLQNCGARIHL
jgi:hypothetical protein